MVLPSVPGVELDGGAWKKVISALVQTTGIVGRVAARMPPSQ